MERVRVCRVVAGGRNLVCLVENVCERMRRRRVCREEAGERVNNVSSRIICTHQVSIRNEKSTVTAGEY